MTIVVADITEPVVVLTKTQLPFVVSVGEQGPRGVDGNTNVTATAAEAIGGHRLVRLDTAGNVRCASSAVVGELGQVVGLTLGAAVVDDPVTIRTAGIVDEQSWAWTPGGNLYLGINGLLTQTAPTSGVLQPVGYAVTATKIFLSIQSPVEL